MHGSRPDRLTDYSEEVVGIKRLGELVGERICGLRSPQHMSGVRTLMWTLKHSALHDCLGFLIAGALPDHR